MLIMITNTNIKYLKTEQPLFSMLYIFRLIKEPLPPQFNIDLPRQLHVTTGSKANLTCQASGNPRPVITWFKNGQRVTSSINGVKSYQSMLIFDSVSIIDEGVYWCEANSIIGWDRSSTSALKGK